MKPYLTLFAALAAISTFAHGAETPQAASEEKKPLRFYVKNGNIRDFFAAIEAQLQVKIIVADDVQGLLNQPITGEYLDAMMNVVCDKMNFSWGKTGNNTYLVVNREQTAKYTELRRGGSSFMYSESDPRLQEARDFLLDLLHNSF